MHRDKRFYRSSGEDMELIKDLPAGALQNAAFYDGVLCTEIKDFIGLLGKTWN